MRRRDFIRNGTAAGLVAWAPSSFGGHLPLPATEAPSLPHTDTYHAPEWLHYSRGIYFDGYSPPLNPRLRDFDAVKLLKIVTTLGGNLLRFQPIGYWAYYPSKAFRVHPDLGNRDLIQEVLTECRQVDVACYCYTGYGHPHMEVGWAEKHPEFADWVLRDPSGKPYGTYLHYGDLVQRVCLTGDVYRAKIRQVVEELCAYPMDGIYFDAPSAFGYSGICFCASCRRNYRAFTGMDLDRLAPLAKLNGLPFDWGEGLPADADMEALKGWYAWADSLVQEDLLYFRRIIHASGKFMLCHNAQSWTGTSVPMQYRIPDGFMVEASREIYDRIATGLMGASMARPRGSTAQMYLGSYAVTWFNEPPYDKMHSVHNTDLEDNDEIRMEGFTDLACGNAPLYATANRLYYGIGSGSNQPAREIFSFMKRTENLLRHSDPVSHVALVPTWESQQRWRERGKSWNWPTLTSGMSLVLLDQHISFDINPSTEIDDRWLSKQKIIALCGASGMSDEMACKLATWVQGGGSLLATYDTGLYDASGRLRQDGGALRDVLGVSMLGAPLPAQPDCYYRITASHPVLGQYSRGAIIEGDNRLVSVKANDTAMVLAECWNLGRDEVRGPAIVANRYGKGRALYIAGSLEANYLYDRTDSTGVLFRSIFEYLGDSAPPPFTLHAPRGVYGIPRQTQNGDPILWLLANVGFKDAAAGRMRQEFVGVPDVRVGIHVTEQGRVKTVRLLRENRIVPHSWSDGYVRITIPSLHIAEAVHVELQ